MTKFILILTFTLDEDELEDKLLDETLPDSLVALFDIIAAAISAPIKLHLLTSSVELISKLLIRTEAGDMFVNDDKVAEAKEDTAPLFRPLTPVEP